MSNGIRISLEVIDECPKYVSYDHSMEPGFRTYQTPWGRYQSGGSAGSFGAHSLEVVELPREANSPGGNLLLRHRSAHSSGSDNFGNAFSHTLDVRMYEVEPEMLEITTDPNSTELKEGIFPSDFGLVPDCRWQIKVPLYGNGLVTVSLCPESAFASTNTR